MQHPILEIALLLLAVLAPMVVLILRLSRCCGGVVKRTDKDGTVTEEPKGIGVRMIQLIAVLILVPVIAVLALEGSLTGEGTGTLLGAIVGYALGGITAAVPTRE